MADSEVKLVEGETWDALAHADLALVASGTATVEAALLGTPMITFYRVHPISWSLGRWMVKAPHLSMVNLLAGRQIVPELMQSDCTGPKLAAAARELLDDPSRMAAVKADLAGLKHTLDSGQGAMERAAAVVEQVARSV
jgi:lipid-A-disaccharide synthase